MSVNPPRTRTLPLNALRTFEAAARHGSFVAAATELGVTPGAVAQQVRKLEAWLGAEIFERNARGVRLAQDRQIIAFEISTHLEALAASARRLRRLTEARSVHIAALPAIAQLWLRPRLDIVAKRIGVQSISVTAQEEPPSFDADLYDAAVFFVHDDRPYCGTTIHVTRDSVTPVCNPAVAARLKHPADLVCETLLHDSVWRADWRHWLKTAGVPASLARSGPVFSLYSMALDAALAGEGVAMGHLPLVREHLDAGRLVQPFDLEYAMTTKLAILLPPESGASGEALANALLGIGI